uniref:Uncharacterized protein n=1 Tax=Cajanus cajan TaxID=3821 RepID=A0A151T8J1_CAJCA|nr:hypothetical protein KK1_017900 [Cajanus cajan]
MSLLHKFVCDPSHVIKLNHLEVRDSLMILTLLVRVKDQMVKELKDKDIPLVKVV